MKTRRVVMLTTSFVLLCSCADSEPPPPPLQRTSPDSGIPVSAAPPAISPQSATLGPRAWQQFTTTIDAPLVWEIEEGVRGGTITAAGVYQPGEEGTFHVRATAVADSSRTALAMVTVVSNGFHEVNSMRFARCNHTATLLPSGKVLVVGYGEIAELFDPQTETFSAIGRPLKGRDGASATLLPDGTVLLAGGSGDTAEIFDPVSGRSRATGQLIQARWGHSATVLPGGQILIVGGRWDPAELALSTAEIFDPASESFQATGSMSTGRADHAAVLLPTGEVLIAGGANGHAPDAADDPPWDPLDSEVYAPGSGTFHQTGLMSTTRVGPAAFPGSAGRVFLVGGVYPLQNRHEQPASPAYAEVYDDATEAVSPLLAPPGAQARFAFTTLPGGKGLIAGGLSFSEDYSQQTYFPDAFLLDLTSGEFSGTGRLIHARAGAVATTLFDGRVLVTGGYDDTGDCLQSAEIYQ